MKKSKINDTSNIRNSNDKRTLQKHQQDEQQLRWTAEAPIRTTTKQLIPQLGKIKYNVDTKNINDSSNINNDNNNNNSSITHNTLSTI